MAPEQPLRKIVSRRRNRTDRVLLSVLFTVAVGDSVTWAGVVEDIPYRTSEHNWEQNFNNLDIYTPADGENLPVVVYIHGGGWAGGDKSVVNSQAQFFNDNQMVYVSINHRVSLLMSPDPYIFPVHPSDVAEAMAWIHENIAGYQGDPEAIALTGHSSGAHLAALVSVDPRYLEANGLDLGIIKATIPLDGGDFDFETRYPTLSTTGLLNFNLVFGTNIPFADWASATPADVQIWAEASPTEYVLGGEKVPPFLFIKAGTRTDMQDEDMAAGINQNPLNEATVWVAEGKNHAGVNTGLGQAGDPMNPVVLDFLEAAFSMDPPDPGGSETSGGDDTTSAADSGGSSDGAQGDSGGVASAETGDPGGTSTSDSSGNASEESAGMQGDDGAGCGCRGATSPIAWWLTPLALGLVRVRRRLGLNAVALTARS